jgi:hypothetical protein
LEKDLKKWASEQQMKENQLAAGMLRRNAF